MRSFTVKLALITTFLSLAACDPPDAHVYRFPLLPEKHADVRWPQLLDATYQAVMHGQRSGLISLRHSNWVGYQLHVPTLLKPLRVYNLYVLDQGEGKKRRAFIEFWMRPWTLGRPRYTLAELIFTRAGVVVQSLKFDAEKVGRSGLRYHSFVRGGDGTPERRVFEVNNRRDMPAALIDTMDYTYGHPTLRLEMQPVDKASHERLQRFATENQLPIYAADCEQIIADFGTRDRLPISE